MTTWIFIVLLYPCCCRPMKRCCFSALQSLCPHHLQCQLSCSSPAKPSSLHASGVAWGLGYRSLYSCTWSNFCFSPVGDSDGTSQPGGYPGVFLGSVVEGVLWFCQVVAPACVMVSTLMPSKPCALWLHPSLWLLLHMS